MFYPAATASSPYPKRSRKKMRDPNAPKGPRNAYMMFIQQSTQKLQKEIGRSPKRKRPRFGAISKELGKRWKALTREERKEFEELSALDKIRYKKEIKEYEESLKESLSEQDVQEPVLGNMDMQQYAQLQQAQWLQMMSFQAQCTQPHALCTQPKQPASDLMNDTRNTEEKENHVPGPGVPLSSLQATPPELPPGNYFNLGQSNLQDYFKEYKIMYESLGYSEEDIERLRVIYVANLTAQTNAYSHLQQAPQDLENFNQTFNQNGVPIFSQNSCSPNLLHTQCPNKEELKESECSP